MLKMLSDRSYEQATKFESKKIRMAVTKEGGKNLKLIIVQL